jgi:hypothetical protein
MKGAVQSLSLLQVARHSISRCAGEVVFATHPVPVGQSADVMQSFVQYARPESALSSTPPQTMQPAQLLTGWPSAGGGPASTPTSAMEASPPDGCAELSEQPVCMIAQSDTTRPPKPRPRDTFFKVIPIPIS